MVESHLAGLLSFENYDEAVLLASGITGFVLWVLLNTESDEWAVGGGCIGCIDRQSNSADLVVLSCN